MNEDTDQLVREFNSYFMDLYRSTSDGDAIDAFLAFESIGSPITPEMFQLADGSYYPDMALEQFSNIANILPVLEDGRILSDSVVTLPGAYELMLATAQPVAGSDLDAFAAIKASAKRTFEEAGTSKPPLLGPYKPALATPPDWCAPGSSAWTAKKFSHTHVEESTQQTPPVIATPGRPTKLARWDWKVLPSTLTSALQSRVALANAQPALAAVTAQRLKDTAPVNKPVIKAKTQQAFVQHSVRAAPVSELASLSFKTQALREPAPAQLTVLAAHLGASKERKLAPEQSTLKMQAVSQQVLALRAETERSRALNSQATQQQVKTSTFSLSFEYCLVKIRRPWISGPLLGLRNWYMPGYRAGEVASGTGTEEGMLEVLPMAALVVRNLAIVADWSAEDRSSSQVSSALGPFSLVGRTFDQVTGQLSCPGMQIVAWVLQTMPRLPPSADPTLPVEPAAAAEAEPAAAPPA